MHKETPKFMLLGVVIAHCTISILHPVCGVLIGVLEKYTRYVANYGVLPSRTSISRAGYAWRFIRLLASVVLT